MLLLYVPPGAHFVIPEAPDMGEALLLSVSDCRAVIRWSRAPEYVHYTTASGKEVEFYRSPKPESITPYIDVRPTR